MQRILVTGAAGFIGYHTCAALIDAGWHVIGIDNLNSYYSKKLKLARLDNLYEKKNFTFIHGDIANSSWMGGLGRYFDEVEHIIHLAAQAGVRYSIDHPHTYIKTNVMGHLNMLELARSQPNLKHFIYASSSSVYGDGNTTPFEETSPIDKPSSLYAATKASDELMSCSYAHLYQIPCTALRFFTVYGPYGRPDMATYSFTVAIDKGKPITLYNKGKLKRDFTYIDDIVDGVVRTVEKPPKNKSKHQCFNLGNSQPVEVITLVREIEKKLQKEAKIEYSAAPLTEMKETCADISLATKKLGFKPKTPLPEGMDRFIDWYKHYHKKGS